MKAPLALSLFCALHLFFAPAAHAETPGESAAGPLPSTSGQQVRLDEALDTADVESMRALRIAMREAMETSRAAEEATVAALVARLEGASPVDHEAIQEEIVAAKQEGWIAMLQIQADFARQAGLDDAALRIEERIETLRAPEPRVTAPRASERLRTRGSDDR